MSPFRDSRPLYWDESRTCALCSAHPWTTSNGTSNRTASRFQKHASSASCYTFPRGTTPLATKHVSRDVARHTVKKRKWWRETPPLPRGEISKSVRDPPTPPKSSTRPPKTRCWTDSMQMLPDFGPIFGPILHATWTGFGQI